jgi:two-component system, OmpR family, phosphate regulon response regulator OmpR
MRILVIDDDAQLAALLREFLEPLDIAVEHQMDGAGMEARLRGSPFIDVLLLDVMLPGRDGFVLCKAARAVSDVPIMMLTARGDDEDRIHGLELGADDYLPKPFNPRELVARLRALVRRRAAGQAEDCVRFGSVTIHLSAMQVARAGAWVVLTTHEFRLLAALARTLGVPVTRETLALAVSGTTYDPAIDRSIDVHIAHLRQKLEDDPKQPKYLRTVRGVGYVLAAVLPDGVAAG